MKLHQRLWRENQDLARACREHRFVRGLEDGSLDGDVFRRYVAQDSFYLKGFMRAYQLAAAHTQGQDEITRVFVRLMNGVVEEQRLHTRLAASLDIDLDEIRPYPVTAAYVDFLLAIARMPDVGVTVAAVTPCMRMYAYLGQALAGTCNDRNPYRDWIETYSSDEMDELAADLESLLDTLAEDSAEVHDAYRQAMKYELEFFDAAFQSSGGGDIQPTRS